MAAATRHKPQLANAVTPTSWRGPVIAGAAIVVLACGGFSAWAGFTSLASAVIASGQVTVDSNRKRIQHLEGGIVKEILVRDGDRVEKGQVLIRLDETRARASLGVLSASWASAKAQEARLIAERDSLPEIVFPPELLSRQDDAKVAEVLQVQRNLFTARRTSLEGETGLLDQKITQLGEEVEGLIAQRLSNERQSEFISEELTGLHQLWKKGLVEKSKVMALERESARLEGERGQRIAEIARTRTAMGETMLKILQVQKAFQESVVTEMRDVQAQITDLEERLSAARHVLAHIEITAPVPGTVVGLGVHTEGGVIRAGDTVLEVVPNEDSLVIEAQLQPSDIDNTRLGQEADVRFNSLNPRSTPVLVGKVGYVSADRLTDQRNGQPYYLVRVIVSDEQVKRLEAELMPGMPAEVMIKTGERTAARYLLQPLIDSFRRAWRET